MPDSHSFCPGGILKAGTKQKRAAFRDPCTPPGARWGRAATQTRPTAPTCLARAVLAPLLVPHFYPPRAAPRSKGKPEQAGLRAPQGGNEDGGDGDTGCRRCGRTTCSTPPQGAGCNSKSSCSSLPRCCANDPVLHVQASSSTARCLQQEKTTFQGAIARHSGNNKSTAVT